MRIESRLFEFVATFFLVVGVIYAVLTGKFATGGVEWAGTTALFLTGMMAMIVATFFRFVARRLDTRPEDYEDAEISDGAGDLGFFSAGSYWPILLAGAAAFAAVALAFFHPWMIVVAVFLIIASAAGLVFEYHLGPEKH